MGKLRDQMLTDLQLCGAKPRTQESYLREAENLAKYFNRSPAELGENELKEYLLYLIKEMSAGVCLPASRADAPRWIFCDRLHGHCHPQQAAVCGSQDGPC
jgi:integrase/recombinase XerD